MFKCDHGHGVFSTPDQVRLAEISYPPSPPPSTPTVNVYSSCLLYTTAKTQAGPLHFTKALLFSRQKVHAQSPPSGVRIYVATSGRSSEQRWLRCTRGLRDHIRMNCIHCLLSAVVFSQVGLVVVRVRTRAIPDMPGIMIGARCSVSKVRCKGTVR